MRNVQTTQITAKLSLALLSEEESNNLAERVLRCPACGYKIGTAFSDTQGHIRTKCQKCKHIWVLNLAYFRRQRPRYQKGDYKS